jgi:hypothetical protein
LSAFNDDRLTTRARTPADLERAIGTYLYSRRMYETMVSWEKPPDLREQPPFVPGLRGDLAGGRQNRLLQDADGVSSARTRIEREFALTRCAS